MKDIEIVTIYNNSFGIAFKWKRDALKQVNTTQLVFKNTGLKLSPSELLKFKNQIFDALNRSTACGDCKNNSNCKSILLETPMCQVSFAMSFKELHEIHDLVDGTLFELDLNSILFKNSITRL